jgi:hypothetical protein
VQLLHPPFHKVAVLGPKSSTHFCAQVFGLSTFAAFASPLLKSHAFPSGGLCAQMTHMPGLVRDFWRGRQNFLERIWRGCQNFSEFFRTFQNFSELFREEDSLPKAV